jgi:hypothetical protein
MSDALKELREKVAEGTVDFDWGFAASPSRKALPEQWHNAMNAYLGSLDAALALHNAVLPGWGLLFNTYRGFANVWEPRDYGGYHASEVPENAARAALIAILDALIAQKRDDD